MEVLGGVAVFAPAKPSGYFRLRWTGLDGRRADTSGGRDLGAARAKAADIAAGLARAAGPQATATLGELFTRYLDEGRSPYTGRRWKRSTRIQIEDNLGRALRGHAHVAAMDVTREVLDRMRAEAGTPHMVRINTTALRAFLLWGYRHSPSFFTIAQAELLPPRVVMPAPAVKGTQAPTRRTRARRVGQADEYVHEEDAPSAAQVRALSAALERLAGPWGALAPELAANCGPRWGEQFQLRAPDVHLDGCEEAQQPHFHIDWAVDPGAPANCPNGRRARPKGDKTRIAPLPTESFTGTRLKAMVVSRLEAVRAEQHSGVNPDALLFPAPRGGIWWHSAFEAYVLRCAMEEAGWPLRVWEEERDVWDARNESYTTRTRTRTLAVMPWHSLRHRFARVAIDLYGADPGVLMALGGWENELTVLHRYYRTGREHTQRGLALFARQ
ncbi:hypothetical protein EXE58_15870 [Nocardioides seonyuensis]|uniref:Tyr recombinase domain-containing protein n=1 Tax=Nocardioides seonyuensis TaxID=2518371 RepID=A0A4P7IHJ7_9ACTN|nr:tyrosine-type recombinase/integrase [Nocardioides seonyuensis]QBX56784.1 hypothetical protein EXE58_15870 [Nocardioides seonyuensis]